MILRLLLLISAFSFPLSAFSQSTPLAADLQSSADWPAINALMIAQRDELTAAHLAALSAASAQFRADLAAKEAEMQAAIAAKAKVEADLAALKQRIDTVLNGLLNEELKTGDGPRAQLLRDLIAQAGKSDAELKREALAAEIAAKQRELEALK